jgi:hypothetical protein
MKSNFFQFFQIFITKKLESDFLKSSVLDFLTGVPGRKGPDRTGLLTGVPGSGRAGLIQDVEDSAQTINFSPKIDIF